VRARTIQLLASVLLGVAVLGTVGVCETRAVSPAGDRHSVLAAAPAVDAVAAPSVPPAPPHALAPLAVATALAPPLSLAALSAPPRADASSRATPLYLRDRALLL